jgi:catechol 2,3-dioxygenase-like lactoylglutathione lyase family enzyme
MSNLTYISPCFIVTSLKTSVSFYVDKLGFEVRHIGPDDHPFWIPNHTRHEWARWDAYISTAEPDWLFEEYRSGGIAFRQPIQDDGDGLRGFEVADADGYVLFFGRPKA